MQSRNGTYVNGRQIRSGAVNSKTRTASRSATWSLVFNDDPAAKQGSSGRGTVSILETTALMFDDEGGEGAIPRS